MLKKTQIVTLILLFSIALNTAFVATWAIHGLPTHFECIGRKAGLHAMCPLHRKLGTSEKQWQEIEPRLEEFKTSSQAVCREIDVLRNELIDIIAAPQTDFEAIRAKQDEILTRQRRMQELLISHLLTEKKMLTAQQQKTLFDMIRQQCDYCVDSSSITNVKPFDTQQVDLNHIGNSNHDE